MMKLLIVGAGGFIGRNLTEHFQHHENSYEIHAPSSTEFDITDERMVNDRLQREYYDVIIHAAVYNPRVGLNKDPSKELDKNLRMFFSFERHRDLFGKMLYFGSGAEFDKTEDISLVNESDKGNGIPTTDYGFYKYIVNKQIQNTNNICNLRVFGLYGKYENWRKAFISGACCKAIKGLPITIKQNVHFDYLFVDDFCRITKWFVDNDVKQREYNVTSGKSVDLITIAEIVKKISGKDIPIYVCEEGLAAEYTARNKQLIDELGSFEFTPLEQGIEQLYSWYLTKEREIDLYSLLYQ